MKGADIVVRHQDLELDPASLAALSTHDDRTAEKNLSTLHGFADKPLSGKPRQIQLRFLVSPIELLGGDQVEAIALGHNRLVAGSNGDLRAMPTGETEILPAGLVFRSVGYLGTGVPGLPYDPKQGIIPNEKGRVVAADGRIARGDYVVGWIKRGPTGVIGTNKPDSAETGDLLLEDFRSGRLARELPDRDEVGGLLAERGVRVVSWNDWRALDAIERGRGEPVGRPRIKFTRVDEMLEALDQGPGRD
jgi:ferredoxin--NADP+ reductase